MKKLTKTIAMIVLASLLLVMLSSCGSAQDKTNVSSEPAMADLFSAQAESDAAAVQAGEEAPFVQAQPEVIPEADTSFGAESNFGAETAFGAESTSGRQDGERFEDVIMLEGMEETVKYEHVKNETIGIEMDYDYENFTRQSGSASEVFISVYDNTDTPENYLELIYTTEDADSAAASIAESLSRNFNINKESRMLAKAGSCTCIDASATKDNQTPDQMQAVYVIPLSNGSVIATMHYSFEAAEGFGRRFSEMLNTLSIIR